MMEQFRSFAESEYQSLSPRAQDAAYLMAREAVQGALARGESLPNTERFLTWMVGGEAKPLVERGGVDASEVAAPARRAPVRTVGTTGDPFAMSPRVVPFAEFRRGQFGKDMPDGVAEYVAVYPNGRPIGFARTQEEAQRIAEAHGAPTAAERQAAMAEDVLTREQARRRTELTPDRMRSVQRQLEEDFRGFTVRQETMGGGIVPTPRWVVRDANGRHYAESISLPEAMEQAMERADALFFDTPAGQDMQRFLRALREQAQKEDYPGSGRKNLEDAIAELADDGEGDLPWRQGEQGISFTDALQRMDEWRQMEELLPDNSRYPNLPPEEPGAADLDEIGAAAPEVVRTIAGAGAGALIDEENRPRGALLGAAAANAPGIARRLRGMGEVGAVGDAELIRRLVEGTPKAADVKHTGRRLSLNLVRHQHPKQTGHLSARGGVFYLPEGSPDIRHYKKADDRSYGGVVRKEKRGEYGNPLIVRAGTGGKGPEKALDMLGGKGTAAALDEDIRKLINGSLFRRGPQYWEVQDVLLKHGGDDSLVDEIMSHHLTGNRLRYAIQENVAASLAKKRGYDAIVSYNLRRETKEPFITEVFDLTQAEYGAAAPEVVRTIAGAGAGALLDEENRPRGALLGGAAANAPGIARRLRGMGQTGAVGDLRPRFYSRLERAIQNAPQEKGTAAQWRGWLSKDVAKGEREWTGIDRMLDEAEAAGRSLTRAEVEQAFKQNEIRLGETVLDDAKNQMNKQTAEEARQQFARAGSEFRLALGRVGLDDTQKDRLVFALESDQGTSPAREFIEAAGVSNPSPELVQAAEWVRQLGRQNRQAALDAARGPQRTKFSGYTEPGGENYREILLTLDRPGQVDPVDTMGREELGRWYEREVGYNPIEDSPGMSTEELRELVRGFAAEEPPIYAEPVLEGFRTQHFPDTPNILAHARVKDRTLPNGERVLFVEEIQSDWHQKGRQQGYKGEFKEPKLTVEEGELQWIARDERGLEMGTVGKGVVATREEAEQYLRRYITDRERQAFSENRGVPDAPFKKTDEWLGLAWRRLIDEAVQGGYDRVSWTTGAQQAARYDLSKKISKVRYTDTGSLEAYDLDGNRVIDKMGVSREQLPDIIGKETADKLLDRPLAPSRHDPTGPTAYSLSGIDMQVGGEGMRAFYDSMLPKVVRDYAKKMGVKLDVEPAQAVIADPIWGVKYPGSDEWYFRGKDRAAAERAAQEVPGSKVEIDAPEIPQNPSIRVTPELRQKVQSEGQYLYSGADIPAALKSESGRVVAGAAAGGAIDAATGEDASPGMGMLVGAGLAAGANRALRPAAKAADPAYLQNPAVQNVLKTVAAGQETPLLSRLTAAVGETPEALRKLYTRVVDQAAPLKRFGREVGGGRELQNEVARAAGWKGAATERLETEFKKVLTAASGHEKGTVSLAKAERALELEANGMPEKGVDLADARETIRELGAVPEVRAAVDALRSYYRALLTYKLENGALTQEAYDAITAKGEYYVPFVRDFAAEKPPTAGGGRLTNRGTGVRKMTDEKATAATVDPFEQAILDTYEAHRTVSKQRVTNVVASIVEADPQSAAPFLRKIAKPEDVKHGRVVQANVEGKRQTYEVLDEELYDAWAAFDPYTGNIFTKALSPFKRSLQFTVTLLPDFAIANAIRDNVQSGIQYAAPVREGAMGAALGAGFGALGDSDPVEGALQGAGIGAGLGMMTPHLARTLSAMRDITGLAGGNKDVYREWLREGGGGFGQYVRDPKSARKMLAQLQKEGVAPSDFINPKSWVDALQAIGHVVEQAPRLARFKHARGAGADVAEAVAQSRDISLDFARSGKDTKGVAAVTAFFNAKVQGWDKLARMLKQPKTYATGAAMITAPSIALWSINKDNPEYWARPQWERNMFWLVPKAGGGFFRIPKPFEIGFIFASVPERILDWQYQKDPETLQFALADMLRTTTEGTMPIPTAIEPLIENKANFDFFRNRPVVSMGMERLPEEMQYDNRTSSVAVGAGKLTGMSPQKIDNLLQGWFGGVGREALLATSKLARATGLDTRPAPTEGKAPILGRFVTRDDQISDAEMAIRRRFEEAEKVRNGALALAKRGDIKGAREYARKNREAFLSYYELKPVNDALSKVSDLRRTVADNPQWTGEQKRQAIAQINTRLVQVLMQPQ